MMEEVQEIVDIPEEAFVPPAPPVSAPVQEKIEAPQTEAKVKKVPEAGPMRVSVADNLAEKNKVLANPAVQQILDIFGGELVDVHIDRKHN